MQSCKCLFALAPYSLKGIDRVCCYHIHTTTQQLIICVVSLLGLCACRLVVFKSTTQHSCALPLERRDITTRSLPHGFWVTGAPVSGDRIHGSQEGRRTGGWRRQGRVRAPAQAPHFAQPPQSERWDNSFSGAVRHPSRRRSATPTASRCMCTAASHPTSCNNSTARSRRSSRRSMRSCEWLVGRGPPSLRALRGVLPARHDRASAGLMSPPSAPSSSLAPPAAAGTPPGRSTA